jgi:hypothetical protein
MRVYVCLVAVCSFLLVQYSNADAKLFKKAKPAESTGFTVDSVMENRADLPFHKVWKDSNASLDNYSEIYIAPINIAYLKENGWWKSLGMKNVEEDIDDIAVYTYDTIVSAFANDPAGRFTLVETPTEKTLIMEMAITELVPNKAGFEAALSAASMGVGEVAMSAASAAGKSFGSGSSVAFEMRLRDGATNKVVGMVADREMEQVAPINVNNFTWYGHAKTIIQSWADQFVKIANKSEGDIISDTPAFTLKVW